jgi:hypothetical protein
MTMNMRQAPPGAYAVSSHTESREFDVAYQDCGQVCGNTCTTGKHDMGDGTFTKEKACTYECHQHCRTRFRKQCCRQVQVCEWTMDEWVQIDSVSNIGSGTESPPSLPDYNLQPKQKADPASWVYTVSYAFLVSSSASVSP